MAGALHIIELNQPINGQRHALMNDTTTGRMALRQRLGRLQQVGDEVILRRFDCTTEGIRALEIG